MRDRIVIIMTMITVLVACSPKNGEKITGKTKTDPFIEQLMAKMTLDEKLGQMTLYTTDWESTGPTIRSGYQDDLRLGRCGALFNSHTVEFTTLLQKIAMEESRLKIPLLLDMMSSMGIRLCFPFHLGSCQLGLGSH
ncbi:MAG: hypothetical protein IPP49_14230 [Saprospiraceae bacterium]|nr:hypothetical protein [Saprospiraceae bacterium]